MSTPRSTPRRRTEPRGTANMQTRFAELLHAMTLRFGLIQETIHAEVDVVRKESREVRGLASWTEDRLESVESRLTELETRLGIPRNPAVEKMRQTMANYRPAVDSLGVKPRRGSLLDRGDT